MASTASQGSRHGLWAAFCGATAIALAPIFAVLAAREDGLAPHVTALWRVALAAPLLAAAALLQRRPEPAPTRTSHYGALLLPGAFFALDLGFWHTAMTHISAGLATLLGNLSVVLVPLAGWFVLGEPYDRRRLPATAVAVLGTALVCVAPDESLQLRLGVAGGNYALGNLLAGATALVYAGYQLSIRRARRTWSTWTVMAASTSTTALLLWLYAAFREERLLPSSGSAWAILVSLALISHCLGQGLIAWALGVEAAYRVALVLLWQPVCSALLSVLLLHQPLSSVQGLGAAIVMVGLAMATRPLPSGAPGARRPGAAG